MLQRHTNNCLLCYLLERPPEVPTVIPVSIETSGSTVNISITWDSAFNLFHKVSSYRVIASGGSAASCPSSCDPSGSCMCTGLGIGEDTTISITAINCGDQMGTPVEVTARPQGNISRSICMRVYFFLYNVNMQFHPDPQNAVFYLFTLWWGILVMLI